MADEALTVRDLVGSQNLWAVSPGQSATDAARTMDEHGFDVAPVSSVPVDRYVTRRSLHGAGQCKVDDFSVLIDGAETLQETTSLALALERLMDRDYYFVQHRHHVTGLVTRADLAKPVVSLFALGLVLSLETAIDRLIVRSANDQFLQYLSEERSSQVRTIFCSRQATNTDISLEMCLNLDDRLKIAKRLHLHESLGFESTNQLKRWSEQLKPFRNAVAHGSGVLDTQPDPVDAITFMLDLRIRCERAWEHVEGAIE